MSERKFDFHFTRWRPFWFGIPDTIMEHIVSVDLRGVWRRNLVWSKKNGADLRTILTQRFSSTTVFLSLLVSTEIGVLFSPSRPADDIRIALETLEFRVAEFWAGIWLAIAIFFSIGALIANFTAWSIFAAISDVNIRIIARCSLGLYAAQLPSRLVLLAIYTFFVALALFWWVIIPSRVALSLSVIGFFLIIHIVSTYSALGRIIMYTSAMADEPILAKHDGEKLLPFELGEALLHQVQVAKKAKVPLNRQYRMNYHDYLHAVEEGRGITLEEWLARESELGGSMSLRELGEFDPNRVND